MELYYVSVCYHWYYFEKRGMRENIMRSVVCCQSRLDAHNTARRIARSCCNSLAEGFEQKYIVEDANDSDYYCVNSRHDKKDAVLTIRAEVHNKPLDFGEEFVL